MIHRVPRVASIDFDTFITRHVLGSTPVVVEDAVKESPAYGRWTFDYIAEAEGSREVLVEFWEDGNTSALASYHRMTLREYIDLHRSSPEKRSQYYFAEWPVERELPSLSAEAPTPPLLRRVPFVQTTGFIGIDTFASIHYHPVKTFIYKSSQSFLTQLCGTKRVLLCRPNDYRKLQYYPWYKALHNQSSAADLRVGGPEALIERITRQGADVWDCELKPGNGLFIPAHWHHAVHGIGENISVTYWWLGPGASINKVLYARDMCALTAKRVVTRPLERLAMNPKWRKPALLAAAALRIIDWRDVDIAAERIKESVHDHERDAQSAPAPRPPTRDPERQTTSSDAN